MQNIKFRLNLFVITNALIMNKLMLILIVGLFSACSSSSGGEENAKESVKTETSENLTEVQELNVELEEIDGELDSLINTLK